jgi:hypothetical protein
MNCFAGGMPHDYDRRLLHPRHVHVSDLASAHVAALDWLAKAIPASRW